MPRLFFALQPRIDQATDIHAVLARLIAELGGRPIAAADLHLTLCFLGEVPAERLADVSLAAAALDLFAAELELCQLDYWPDSRVLCLTPATGANLQQVTAIATTLRSNLASRGVPCDAKPFRPHVTASRGIEPATAQLLCWPMRLPAPMPFTADGLSLLRSTGATSTPRYVLHKAWRRRAASG